MKMYGFFVTNLKTLPIFAVNWPRSKETWFLILGWVPRRRLGQIVPQIGDRQFAASIAQPFLHNYGHITLANICITGPGHRLIRHGEVPMPTNITYFSFIGLRF
jgi:hypothetical protein